MKILAINGSYRPEGTTALLTRAALDGAEAAGAETEMIVLRDRNIQYCRNCLACYNDLESEIAPCPIKDDVTGILEKLRDADGVIFSSPVHSGFVSGIMVAFLERAIWRLSTPTGELMGLRGIPEPRLRSKARAVATIVSAGGIPQKMRKFCDQGTPWLRETVSVFCNGMPVGDVYAGAVFTREPAGEDWKKLYFMRKLTDGQLGEAWDLGVRMAGKIGRGRVKPFDMARSVGLVPRLAGTMLVRLTHPIETIE